MSAGAATDALATIDAMELRLQRWAEWCDVGETCGGYSAINPISEDWSPPTAGRTPAPRVWRPSDARETDQAVRQLSQRLQDTLACVYVRRMRPAEAAEWLDCTPETVPQRVREAKRRIAAALAQDQATRAENAVVNG